jgi:GntR family transcriptional regulator, carbon starvation induced regulator
VTLAEKAYAELRRDIVSGVLRPLQPLRLDHLRQRYGIGFSPLREALSRLQGERLVQAVALRGFSVAPISRAEMWDAIGARILIESRAVRLAIVQGDDEWEARVVASLHALSLQYSRLPPIGQAPIEQTLALEERHREFHRALISACGSNWLMDFAEKLYAETERYRFASLRRAAAKSRRDPQREHAALLDAALKRDDNLASQLLERHYRLTGELLEVDFDGGEASVLSA